MIVASKLTKFYGTHPAIRDLSFNIEEGEIVGFLGLNGAGKSTTLRIISCQLVPSSGSVTVAGLDVLEQSGEIRKRIGYLPEVAPLYQEMTVRAFLEFVAELKGVPRADVAASVVEVEKTTRLTDVNHQVIGTLSAGYRQRVGIAQAVVHKPDLLILDEPFAGLDPVQTVEMREMIRALGGKHTVLLSSHILSQIHKTCDRILVIQKGRIVAQGSEDELVAQLTGGSRIELVVRGEADDVATAVEAAGGRLVDSDELEPGLFRVVASAGDGDQADDLREALAKALVDAGLGLRELRQSAAELESVFVQLTQDGGPAPEAAAPSEAAEPAVDAPLAAEASETEEQSS